MRRRAIALGLLALAGLAATRAAAADEKAACIRAHEHGQELRIGGRWIEARSLLLACAQPACPAPLVRDCTQWSGELARQIPTVVVAATAPDGTDTDDAVLSIDGARVAARLPSTPVALDPGEHLLRFEHPGWTAIEERLVLHDGERERPVRVRFAAPRAPAPPSPPPVAAYAATAVAAAVTAASITFLVLGKVREHDLATSPCGRAGTCSDASVDPIRTDYVVAGVAAGVAAVAAGVAIWQFLAHRPSTTAAAPALGFAF